MIPQIVDSKAPVTLIGGCQLTPAEISEALTIAPLLVAADGGAASCIAAGHRPVAVIGDMDSLDPATRATLGTAVHEIAEQATTDFEKCLQRIAAPAILALGFLGGRIDHTLSALNVAARRRNQTVLLSGAEDTLSLVPEAGLSLELPIGMRLSLLPFGPARCLTRGLKWNLNDEPLRPDGMISISNEVAATEVRIMAEGPVFVAVPQEGRKALWTALLSGVR